MGFAYMQDGLFQTCAKQSSVPGGVERVEFERGSLPAAPEF